MSWVTRKVAATGAIAPLAGFYVLVAAALRVLVRRALSSRLYPGLARAAILWMIRIILSRTRIAVVTRLAGGAIVTVLKARNLFISRAGTVASRGALAQRLELITAP